MKKSLFLMSMLLTLPLFAADLTVNEPYEETITDATTLEIAAAPEMGTGTILVLNADVLFTIPSETPLYDDVVSEKLALAVDTDGKILIADATQNGGEGGWLKTAVATNEVTPITVFAEGKVKNGKLVFDVKLEGSPAYTVTSPSDDLQLDSFETVGEGTVSDLSLAMVDTNILPGGVEEDASLDADLVKAYMKWITDVLKGKMPSAAGALPEGVNPADAFVMNVAGKPELKIEKVDPVNGTITLVGTSTVGETTATVSLENINGKIYISWQESLSGEVSVTEAEVTERSSEKFVLSWPDVKARFIKAAVSREAPAATTSL